MVENVFPIQTLPSTKKNKEWRKRCVKWAEGCSALESSLVRKTVENKRINYNLLNGKLNMKDLKRVLNPNDTDAEYIPSDIKHYPIMNSKLNVLRGEESSRLFDYKLVVTNQNAISEIEEAKLQALHSGILEIIKNKSQDEETYKQELEKLADFFSHNWQDIREVRGNYLLNHYMKEYNIPLLFNKGFMDALAVGEEIYRCDIISGEPTIERLNPEKVRVFKSGYSSNIEDADIIVIEDYWNPSRIVDVYHEVLTTKDIKYLEDSVGGSNTDDSFTEDVTGGFINTVHIDKDSVAGDAFYSTYFGSGSPSNSNAPIDANGNIRVLNVYWKSRRKVKKVKLINPETGEETWELFPETYIINESLGEEEKILWINEAWEGTLIGKDIFVNMRPRPIQYNRLSNPSRCHFGIIGSIYNLNDSTPFSFVDMMKPYNYLYDVVYDRLTKLIADNWGKIVTLDLAKVPKGWQVDKWMYYAKTHHLAVVDSFNEGKYGSSTGVLAGGLNNNNSGVIDAEMGQSIQFHIQLLEFIKNDMGEVAGISRQREGQVMNRETVGGVERSTLQSSYITEWIFFVHEDLKKRVLECFLETAKIALKGSTKKFQYILPGNSLHIASIDGDEFAESDYGLVLDNSSDMQQLNSKLDTLAQAALQNQLIDFSTIMKMYSSASISEKMRFIEKSEKQMQQRQQEQMQQQQQIQQQQIQAQMEQLQAQQEFQYMLNSENNETKLMIAQINADSNAERSLHQTVFRIDDDQYSEEEKEDMARKKQEFSDKMKLERDKLALQKETLKQTVELKKEALKVQRDNKQQTK